MTVAPRPNANAVARREMARERAKIAGRRPALPSPLEQAAQERKAQEERQQMSLSQPGDQTSVVALQRMPLRRRSGRRPPEGGFAWEPLPRADEAQPRQVTINGAMVTRIAQHLKAKEWARALGKRRQAAQGPSLEAWAERWMRAQVAQEKQAAGAAADGTSAEGRS